MLGSRVSDRGRARRWWAAMAAAAGLMLAGAGAGAQEDPPGRVGRLNFLQGEVSFSPAGSDEWVEGRSSRPITSGDRLWMDRGARSELSIGSTVLRADGETSLKVLQLDDDQAQFQLSEGTLAVQVRNLDADDRLEIATPDLAFVIDRPGDYRLRVDPADNSTEVLVRHGQGWAYADDGRHRLDAPAYARFVGERLDHVSADLPGPDGFDRWVEARIDRIESRPSSRYVSRELVGYEDLDDHGSWRQEPDYGWVWTPRITVSTWAPYRYGHWAWIAPWGWTWVDDAPWGFAPFHYGRWAYVRSRWCWVPGPIVRRPYYAPALVAFVGGATGWHARSARGPAVAWFPLGPREEYRPVYRASTTYITRINQVVVIDRERGGGRRPSGEFANRHVPGAFSAIPTRAFVEGRPVGRERLHIADDEVRQAPVAGTMPSLAPVQASLVGEVQRRGRPPRQDRERQVVTTRMPAPPPVERDELAKRFAQGGGVVSEAGPSLAERVRRTEDRQDKRPRLVTQRAEGEGRVGGEERRQAPGAVQTPQAERQRDGERDRPNRDLRGPQEREQGARPDNGERARRQEAREADRPGETPRAMPEPRRGREEGPRESGARPDAARGAEAAPARPQRPDRLEELIHQRERAEPQRREEPRAAPEPRRERGPERSPDADRGGPDRSFAPPAQAQPDRGQPRFERQQEERRPREADAPREEQRPTRVEPRVRETRPERAPQVHVQQERSQPRVERPEPREMQREQRMEARTQERARPEPRGGEGGRERREAQQRERGEQGPRHPGQPE